MRTRASEGYVGTSVKRFEDRRLLIGAGNYIDDMAVPGMLHAAFLRSSFAHAKIERVDAHRARMLPGVHLVLTGSEIVQLTNPLQGFVALPGLFDAWYWALAVDRVRYVGDPVAIVIADSRAIAEDAIELIEVDYAPLDVITSVRDARGDHPAIWPRARGNILYRSTDRHGDVDAAFGRAHRVISQRFDQHRHSNQPMETRGSVAEIDPRTGALTLHSTHQAAHMLKWAIAYATERKPAHVAVADMFRRRDQTFKVLKGMFTFLRENPSMIRDSGDTMRAMARQLLVDPARGRHLGRAVLDLIARDPRTIPEVEVGDVGGAFGAKTTVLREDVALCAAALATGRTIKWIEDRNEHLIAGAQARDESMEIQAAVTDDGEILGLRASLEMDAGAYFAFPYGAPMFSRIIKTLLPGPYRIPALEFHSTIAATNKPSYVAYRGPWAVETWVRERMLDVIAAELGQSRPAIRLKNLVGPDELPRSMVTGPTLDVRMSAKATFERALEIADFETWEERKAAALKEGRRIGLGFSTYIEPGPGPAGYLDHILPGMSAVTSKESAVAALELDGTVTAHTPQVPHGQGHETTLAQVAADKLGVPPEMVRVSYGSTRSAPFGILGTGGSRSATMASGAVGTAAERLREAIVGFAASHFEDDVRDLEIVNGAVQAAGSSSKALGLSEIARRMVAARGVNEHGEAMRVDATWDGGTGGWAQSTHVCWVELDLETGFVTIPRYVVVEDCGELINPAIVEGQIRGGVAQGVGAVLYEKTIHDADGNPLTGTFMDYLIPTASEIPEIEIHHVETPSDVPYNHRGVGEGGMIGAPAAITSAIEDALSDLGVRVTEQHLPPTRILELAEVITSA